MEECYSQEVLDIFRYPARIIVAGPSNSGKTQLVAKLIEKYHTKFSHIVMCGTSSHPLTQHKDIGKKISLHDNIVDPLKETDEILRGSILYVLDDLFMECTEDKTVVNTFTKGRHHNISIIFITQNLFFSGKHARNISLNCSHYFLFRQRDVQQVEYFSRQVFGKGRSKEFLEMHRAATKASPFGYIFIDLALNTPESLQVRSNVVGEGECEIVYQWQNTNS